MVSACQSFGKVGFGKVGFGPVAMPTLAWAYLDGCGIAMGPRRRVREKRRDIWGDVSHDNRGRKSFPRDRHAHASVGMAPGKKNQLTA